MRTVKVRITRSFNVGNYESIKPEVELEGNALDVDLPQTASFQEIYIKLYEYASMMYKHLVSEELKMVEERRK